MPLWPSTILQQYADGCDTIGYPFGVLLPTGYDLDPDERFPAIVHFLGVDQVTDGSRASMVVKLAMHGPFSNTAASRTFLQSDLRVITFVVSSMWNGETFWYYPPRISKWLDFMLAHFKVNPDAVSFTGLSMGGRGVMQAVYCCADKIVVAAPCSSGEDPHLLHKWLAGDPTLFDPANCLDDHYTKWLDQMQFTGLKNLVFDQMAKTIVWTHSSADDQSPYRPGNYVGYRTQSVKEWTSNCSAERFPWGNAMGEGWGGMTARALGCMITLNILTT